MHSIQLNNKEIFYQLKKSNRKTLGIEVNFAGCLIVTAPNYIALPKIEDVIKKKKHWILQKIKEKKSNLQIQPTRQFVSGESFKVFGKQYQLKVTVGKQSSLQVSGMHILVTAEHDNNVKSIVIEWLRIELKQKIEILFSKCLKFFNSKMNTAFNPQIQIRKMKKRWGSFTESKKIILNFSLIAAPEECIEYVIYHELVHLLHACHDTEFTNALEVVCPKFKQLKFKLENETILFEL